MLLAAAFIPGVHACTAFKVTSGGRTFIGNNEDSWCIHARIHFVPGSGGDLGAVYFSSWTGHPFLPWVDQLGMNAAGLVFDGLGIQPKDVAPAPGKPVVHFSELAHSMLERCQDVTEAVAFLQQHDLIFLHKSMLFLADAQGNRAVVQNDTVLLGQEADFAVGNWRLACGTDMDAIPIPRLQKGRDLLKAGIAPTLEGALSVLQGMRSCREFLGNGTLFSTLFEPDRGKVHVYFYHDFAHPVAYDLREELTKGARTVDLPSLFPPNAEFEALQRYRTPFHQRWLFMTLAALAGLAVLLGVIFAVAVLVQLVQRLRLRPVRTFWPLVLLGLGMVALVALVGILLTLEQVVYFGLGDVHPALRLLPHVLLATALVAALRLRRHPREHWALLPALALIVPVLVGCAYWGLF